MEKTITGAIERRDFLRAGGASLVGLASSRYLAGLPSRAAQQERTAPENPVILRSPQIELILDRQAGLPFEFRLLTLKATMRGEEQAGKSTSHFAGWSPGPLRPRLPPRSPGSRRRLRKRTFASKQHSTANRQRRSLSATSLRIPSFSLPSKTLSSSPVTN